MTRALRFATTAALAATFSLHPSAFSLTQQPPIRVGTTLVTVDVYPTRDGEPVEGLTAADFEIREDGRAQAIETFEFVRFEAGGTEEEIRDPNNQREMAARIADPRSRLFVLFLDTPHVGLDGSHRSRLPLLNMLRRTLSPNDLFGVMTPESDVRSLAFARSLTSLEAELARHWEWGDASKPYLDEIETLLENCYASTAGGILPELYARRREERVLYALEELVAHLEGLREGRKVVFLFGSGWTLFEPSDEIIRTLAGLGGAMAKPPVGVTSDGKLRLGADVRDGTLFGCDAEAQRLAQLRHGQRFRDLVRAAALANVAFYPVHLVGVGAGSRGVDQFRSLASETDGEAVTMTNDLGAGLEQVTRPLMAYYLIGYTPTNTRADGRVRRIQVRVRQPGVQVRGRRAYRALTEAELASMNTAAARPAASAFEATVSRAVARLAQIHEAVHMYVHGIAASTDGGDARLWITGELDAARARKDWAEGGTVELTIGSAPEQVTATATLAPGARAWTVEVPLLEMPDGNVPIRTRLTAPNRLSPLAGSGALHGERPEALLFRRSPATGTRYQPAADRRFSRTERLRLEVPAGPAGQPGRARLLDVKANPLNVPVTLGERIDDGAGVRWITADLVLAPLGAGDYAVEIVVEGPTGEQSILTAIRVTR